MRERCLKLEGLCANFGVYASLWICICTASLSSSVLLSFSSSVDSFFISAAHCATQISSFGLRLVFRPSDVCVVASTRRKKKKKRGALLRPPQEEEEEEEGGSVGGWVDDAANVCYKRGPEEKAQVRPSAWADYSIRPLLLFCIKFCLPSCPNKAPLPKM